MSLNPDVSVTWMGHSTFAFKTPDGNVVMVDPWLKGNPACPDDLEAPATVDAVLITHGHFDHIGDTITLAAARRPQAVVGSFEVCEWLTSKGVENTVGMNKGGTVEAAGCQVTMVHAVHSGGITDGDRIAYGGEAAGFVIRFSNGFTLYHAGDTDLFSDMTLIGELHHPDVALLPIGGHYTMGPREAALACKLLGVSRVVPMHFGTFPVLAGTPAELRSHLEKAGTACEVVVLEPGQTT